MDRIGNWKRLDRATVEVLVGGKVKAVLRRGRFRDKVAYPTH